MKISPFMLAGLLLSLLFSGLVWVVVWMQLHGCNFSDISRRHNHTTKFLFFLLPLLLFALCMYQLWLETTWSYAVGTLINFTLCNFQILLQGDIFGQGWRHKSICEYTDKYLEWSLELWWHYKVVVLGSPLRSMTSLSLVSQLSFL